MGSKKIKGLFIEGDAYTLRSARVSSLMAPLRIESVAVQAWDGGGGVETILDKGKASGSRRYIPAHCAFAPDSRYFFLHKAPSLTKAKESAYWAPVLRQARLDSEEVMLGIMEASSGRLLEDLAPGGGARDLLVCGARRSEWKSLQEALVGQNIVPQRLELGGLSALAGLRDYLQWKQITSPVLFFEMGKREAHLFILCGGKVVLCRGIAFGYESVLPLIRSELGLKEDEAARHLFFSNTFDFRDIGSVLFSRLLRDLNAASGFYEMQTGHPLHGFVMTGTPAGLDWIPAVIATGLEISALKIDWEGWLSRHQIAIGETVESLDLTTALLPLLSLMMKFHDTRDEG